MSLQIKRRLNTDERNALGSYSDIVAHLLFHRNFSDHETALAFISPNYDAHSHDPFLLKDAEKAARRIIQAIQAGEKIAIYSDYDADGIPAAAIWHDFFGRIGFANFVIYIPHRHDEGFGVNEKAVRSLAEQGVKLIVTADCGIADRGPIAVARELGIDVIVTDHHEPPSELPLAYAIIDHKQADCAYPDKNICGSGVAYKLIQAILALNRFGLKEGVEKWLLDLVGIATLSDMVPLVGENRVFAYYGLQVLRKTPRKGLIRLLDHLKLAKQHLTESDIAFMITPRINAASRMGVPMDAFYLLAAQDDVNADTYVQHLDHINNERKGIVASLVKEVKKLVRERHGQDIPAVIVLGNPLWRPALLGLAANSCAEEFGRPVFLWGRDGDNMIKGSCRSEGTTNIVELMRAAPAGTFTQFGGHRHSGGFAVDADAIHHLDERLNAARAQVSAAALAPESKEIDMELTLDDVSWQLELDISQLAPFGTGNPKPVFLFRAIRPVEVRIFGKAKDHIELVFRNSRGSKVSAISFFGAESQWASKVKKGEALDLIASVEKSVFRGRPELRLRVEEVVM